MAVAALRDATGRYDEGFMLAGLAAMGALAVALLPRPGGRDPAITAVGAPAPAPR